MIIIIITTTAGGIQWSLENTDYKEKALLACLSVCIALLFVLPLWKTLWQYLTKTKQTLTLLDTHSRVMKCPSQKDMYKKC